MSWKSSFWHNYRTKFSPTVPNSAVGISHFGTDVEAPGGGKWVHLKSREKQWQPTRKNFPRIIILIYKYEKINFLKKNFVNNILTRFIVFVSLTCTLNTLSISERRALYYTRFSPLSLLYSPHHNW